MATDYDNESMIFNVLIASLSQAGMISRGSTTTDQPDASNNVWRYHDLFVHVGYNVVLPFIQPWGAHFGIPTICFVVATLQFFLRSSPYIRVKPSGSRTTSLFRVIVATSIKIQLSCPKDSRELYEKYDLGNDQELLPHTNCLRSIIGRVKQKHIPAKGIGFGIMISIFCCIVVALVEQRRLNVAKGHGLINVPHCTIPMSIFWLIPQFLLLGAPQGIVLSNKTYFLVNQVPNSLQSYLRKLTEAFLGVGYITSVLTVNVVGKISDERGGENWFGETLNKSRLHKYSYTLAKMSCANLFFYALVASWFNYKEVHIPTEEQEVVDEERFQYHEE
ncbi:unnamed protein product [Ilex paraguariensis]|uniref:Uncharacterized protein n=1 Tax=Ilex paraguariensis TaxID=185542 RepID=A0ABC8QSL8_9AQUA